MCIYLYKLPVKYLYSLNLHHLLNLMSFQTCTSFFLLLNIKEDILKNQTAVGPQKHP